MPSNRVVAFELSLAVLAGVIGWLIGFSPYQTLAVDVLLDRKVWFDCLIGLIATFPLVIGMLMVDRSSLAVFQELKSFVHHFIIEVFQHYSIAELLLISLAAGFGEEVLFRGLIQHGLSDWMANDSAIWLAILITSILFGLAHPVTPTYVLLATAVSVYLGVIFWWSESLVPPIVTHAAYDFAALVYLVRAYRDGDGGDQRRN